MRLRTIPTVSVALSLAGCGLVGSTPQAVAPPPIRIVVVESHRDRIEGRSTAAVARAVSARLSGAGVQARAPATPQVNRGFEADDTGGAILSRHIDVFRPPPASPSDLGNFLTDQPVYVVAPGRPLP